MSKRQLEFSDNLVEFAQDLQNELINQPFDRRVLLAVEALRLLGSAMLNTYDNSSGLLIDSRLAFWKPRQEIQPTQKVIMFDDRAFEGYAPNFSYLSLGDIERHPINSICIALSNVKLLPGGESLPENDEIHIPVMAVEQILQFA